MTNFATAMGVDLSLVVRNRFTKRDNREETLKKLQEVKVLLDDNFGEGCFAIVDDDDLLYIVDNREDGNDDVMQIELYNGFWHIETAWRFHQYFNIFEGRFWLREKLFKYVNLLGQSEAYTCAEYMTWNSRFWKDEQTTFDYWLAECTKEIGHGITILDTEDVRACPAPFYYKDPVHLDTFADLS